MVDHDRSTALVVVDVQNDFADPKGSLYVGEDMAFCLRWVEGCGGEIWSVVTETILHVGTDRFVGRFLTKLEHGLA